VEIVISSVPLIALVPDQAPEALQLVALVYQVNVITESNETDADELERVVVGLGSGVGVLPPTPPPPHAEMKSKIPSEYTNSLKFLKKIVLLLSTSLILA